VAKGDIWGLDVQGGGHWVRAGLGEWGGWSAKLHCLPASELSWTLWTTQWPCSGLHCSAHCAVVPVPCSLGLPECWSQDCEKADWPGWPGGGWGDRTAPFALGRWPSSLDFLCLALLGTQIQMADT
jgi:hypothetical protein